MIVGFISMAAVILLALLRVPLGIALMSVSLAGLAYITSTTTALTLFPMTERRACLSCVKRCSRVQTSALLCLLVEWKG
mgnify:CR=1 FL=1